jgi:hypothetical protein
MNGATPMRIKGMDPVWAVALVAATVALGWTFYHLADRSYWFDELTTVAFGSPGTPSGAAIEIIRTDVHPFLYSFAIRGWLNLLNSSNEWAARSFNAVPLAAALIGSFWAYRNRIAVQLGIWFGIFFLSFGLLWYLQDARMYASMICHSYLVCLFALVYEKARGDPPTPSFVFATIAIFVVLPFVHWFAGLFSGLVLFGLFLLAMVEKRYKYAVLFLLSGVAFAALAAAWIVFNWQSTLGRMGDQSQSGGLMLWQLRSSFVGMLLYAYSLNPILLAAAAFGAGSLLYERRRTIPLIVLASLAVGWLIILAASYVEAKKGIPLYEPRYFTWVVGPLTMLAALGLGRLAEWYKLQRSQIALGLAAVILVNLLIGPFAEAIFPLPRDQWRQAGQFVLAQPNCAEEPIPALMHWHQNSMAGNAWDGQDRRIYGYYGGGAAHIRSVYGTDTQLPKRPEGDKCRILLWIGQMTEDEARSRGMALLGRSQSDVAIVHFPGHSIFLAKQNPSGS